MKSQTKPPIQRRGSSSSIGLRNRGWLKNGNPPGDFLSAARCGAKTRRATTCRQPAMKNGRCRLHGGKSTGPKTAAGIRRIQEANTKHGFYSKQAIEDRRVAREAFRHMRALLSARGRL